ncbi:hypothetical protein L1887_62735 [Cichorium endivia]|nr:hypothetical protein L1887_62735 [Cichorium endivia]
MPGSLYARRSGAGASDVRSCGPCISRTHSHNSPPDPGVLLDSHSATSTANSNSAPRRIVSKEAFPKIEKSGSVQGYRDIGQYSVVLVHHGGGRELVVDGSDLFGAARHGDLLQGIGVLCDTQRNDGDDEDHSGRTQAPRDGEVGHEGVLVVVHGKRARRTRRLHRLVESRERKDVADVLAAVLEVDALGLGVDGGTRVGLLDVVRAAPYGPHDDKDDGPADPGARPARHALVVEDLADGETADHLAEPVEKVVERASAQRKEDAVVVVELPGVEPVGGEEHGEHEHHPGVGLEQDKETLELLGPGGLAGDEHARAIISDHLGRVHEHGRDKGTEACEHDEGSIGAVGNRVGGRVVGEAELDGRAEYGAQIENDPEDADEGQEGTDVEAVAECANAESKPRSELVVDRTGKEGDRGEGREADHSDKSDLYNRHGVYPFERIRRSLDGNDLSERGRVEGVGGGMLGARRAAGGSVRVLLVRHFERAEVDVEQVEADSLGCGWWGGARELGRADEEIRCRGGGVAQDSRGYAQRRAEAAVAVVGLDRRGSESDWARSSETTARESALAIDSPVAMEAVQSLFTPPPLVCQQIRDCTASCNTHRQTGATEVVPEYNHTHPAYSHLRSADRRLRSGSAHAAAEPILVEANRTLNWRPQAPNELPLPSSVARPKPPIPLPLANNSRSRARPARALMRACKPPLAISAKAPTAMRWLLLQYQPPPPPLLARSGTKSRTTRFDAGSTLRVALRSPPKLQHSQANQRVAGSALRCSSPTNPVLRSSTPPLSNSLRVSLPGLDRK